MTSFSFTSDQFYINSMWRIADYGSTGSMEVTEGK